MTTKRSPTKLRVLRGGHATGTASTVSEEPSPEPWMATGEGLDRLSDTELAKVVLQYVVLPQALGAEWNAVLYEVVYRLLGQRPAEPQP